MLPGEQVHVLNLHSGTRLVTYAITAPRGTGTVMLNGPAARLGMPGDMVTILTYCDLEDAEARAFRPSVVLVDDRNRPRVQ
jgi:aspartate 1-decarboxylase